MKYRILTTTGKRPFVIVDGRGYRVFSFKTSQWELAEEILHNLNGGIHAAA